MIRTGRGGPAAWSKRPAESRIAAHLYRRHRRPLNHVAASQRAVGDQHCGHRASTAVELGFDHLRPLSSATFGLARKSSTSACSAMAPSRLIGRRRASAETLWYSVSLPHSSATSLSSLSWRLTRSGLASGSSPLLMATTMGTLGRLGVGSPLRARLRHFTPSSVGDYLSTTEIRGLRAHAYASR